MKELKIKIVQGYGIEKLRGKTFIADQHDIYASIKYEVRGDGFHNKTKYVGKVIPNEFFVEV